MSASRPRIVRGDTAVDEASGTLIRFAERPVTAWANGQGETVVLWRTPAAGDPDVRLSIATVGRSGPFSSLPGIDRMLMPLAEPGLTLRIGDSTRHVAQYDAVAFAGEDEVASVEVTQPGFDLNLMVRRGVGVAHLAAVRVDGSVRVDVPGLVAVIALAGDVHRAGQRLAFGDTVLAGAGSGLGAGPGDGSGLGAGSGAVTLTGDGRVAVASLG